MPSDRTPNASQARPPPNSSIVSPLGIVRWVGGDEEFRFPNDGSVELSCQIKKRIQAQNQLLLLADRSRLWAHLLLVLDPLVDGGDRGAGAVLEGEDSLLDESDGSHFDDGVGGFDVWSKVEL